MGTALKPAVVAKHGSYFHLLGFYEGARKLPKPRHKINSLEKQGDLSLIGVDYVGYIIHCPEFPSG